MQARRDPGMTSRCALLEAGDAVQIKLPTTKVIICSLSHFPLFNFLSFALSFSFFFLFYILREVILLDILDLQKIKSW